MPVTIVCCCAGEGVKVPPLELTIEDVDVMRKPTPAELPLDLWKTKGDLTVKYGH